MIDAGTLPLCEFGESDSVPLVCHMISGTHRYRPDALFVGYPTLVADISPWSQPLPSCDFAVNVDFLAARCDLRVLLWPLRNKILYCNCNQEREKCWAWLLADTFLDIFIPGYGGDFQFHVYGNTIGCMDYGAYDELQDADNDGDTNIMVQRNLPRHADLAAGGNQGSRHRPQQLVPDGLPPLEHLRSALRTRHPYVDGAISTPAVTQALNRRRFSAEPLVKWRNNVMDALLALSGATAHEDALFLDQVHPLVGQVLRAFMTKNLAMMRELWFISQPQDYSAVAALCVGLPMIGWTPPAFGLMPRVKEPSSSYDVWKRGAVARNSAIIHRVNGSNDRELDTRAFNKTMEETVAGVLIGPFYSLDEIPCDCPGVAPRCGIWEQHGEAVEADVRNIDDLLVGEQNSTAGSLFSHRPTDADALVAQCRAVARKCPHSSLKGWSSDFSKAYKQVPGDPHHCLDIVLAQFDPVMRCAAFFVALSQVFGSKTSPVNFSRYPAAFCHIVAGFFLLPATHCVDDVIFIEEEMVVDSGKMSWDLLMKLCGWRMSESKDAPPSSCFPIIGVSLNLEPFPNSDPTVLITARRISSLIQLIGNILVAASLGSGEAASLSGKVGFALSVTFGKVGRCRVRPILRRAYSRARHLNEELRSCLLWWRAFLRNFTPRPIPTALENLPVVVSYSDGEGGLAGIGAAIWHPWKSHPLAVYSEVPVALREH